MFFIDTHVHSSPTSLCAHISEKDLPPIFKSKGFHAFVLTNHYYKRHFEQLGSSEIDQKMQYVSAFYNAFDAGQEVGVKVLFGSEIKVNDVRIIDGEEVPFQPEFLIFGLTPQLILKSPLLYLLNQKELFEFCNANGLLMYQAHPFRTAQGYYPANPAYLHGVEVFNGHPNFPARSADAIQFANENGLKLSAGSDLHIDSQAGTAGIILPYKVETSTELCEFLKEHTPVNVMQNELKIEF